MYYHLIAGVYSDGHIMFVIDDYGNAVSISPNQYATVRIALSN